MMEQTWTEANAAEAQLSDEEVSGLLKAGFRKREDYEGDTPEILHRVANISYPAAKRILKLAGVGQSVAASPAATPARVEVSLKPPRFHERLTDALGELKGAGRVSAVAELRELNVFRVARDDKGNFPDAPTLDYIDANSPLTEWWEFEGVQYQIVGLDNLDAARPHHPRTGVPLERGRDPVGWLKLKRDQQVVAAAIYLEGLHVDDAERAVFGHVQAGTSYAATAAQRLRRSADLRHRAQARIDGIEAPSDSPRGSAGDGAPPPAGGRVGALSCLFEAIFSGDELRRFVRFLPGGARLSGLLPGGTVSAASLAFSAAELLERDGRIDGDLRSRLTAERPRRANEIDATFDKLGIR